MILDPNVSLGRSRKGSRGGCKGGYRESRVGPSLAASLSLREGDSDCTLPISVLPPRPFDDVFVGHLLRQQASEGFAPLRLLASST